MSQGGRLCRDDALYGADVLLGSSGSDVLIGDNAQTDLASSAP